MSGLQPNIGKAGRVLRLVIGLLLLGAACLAGWLDWPLPLVLGLAVGGAFAVFEAKAGWCAARACGIKTRI